MWPPRRQSARCRDLSAPLGRGTVASHTIPPSCLRLAYLSQTSHRGLSAALPGTGPLCRAQRLAQSLLSGCPRRDPSSWGSPSSSNQARTAQEVTNCSASNGPGIISFAVLMELARWLESREFSKGCTCETPTQSPPAPIEPTSTSDSTAPGVAATHSTSASATRRRSRPIASQNARARRRSGGAS